MMKLLFLTLLLIGANSYCQNLPSLLTDKNINSTFSILAYDESAKEWGIAVATNNIYVGNSTIYIRPGIGAFSVIAETDPIYAIQGFTELEKGQTIEEAIKFTKIRDNDWNFRQVSGIDANGSVFAFTGESLKYWHGVSNHLLGVNYVVMGNQLADDVLTEMSYAFENTTGTLASRLMKSLSAGENAGGQISGKQSAALVVRGAENEWFNQIDLRVDNSSRPLEELQELMNFHYGRILLNQSLSIFQNGNEIEAMTKLKQAESLLIGWDGMYGKIAKANIILGDEDKAVKWIKKGLQENPKWSVNIPAFYFLREHPQLKPIISPKNFSNKDWSDALSMLSSLGREGEVLLLGHKLIDEGITSSYIYYLIGRSYYFEEKLLKSSKYLKRALKLDPLNIEAKRLMRKLENSKELTKT